MFPPEKILLARKCIVQLEKLNLLDQYKKAYRLLLAGDYKSIDFKKRRPYKNGVYYFRLTRQYRALGRFEGNIFKVSRIDNHSR